VARGVLPGFQVGVQAPEIQTALVQVDLPAQNPPAAHPPLGVRLPED
jgi:hypothetical protein